MLYNMYKQTNKPSNIEKVNIKIPENIIKKSKDYERIKKIVMENKNLPEKNNNIKIHII